MRKYNEPYPTIGELIKNKDYDYIEYRICIPDYDEIFAGVFKSENGEIISLDGDSYSKDEKIIASEEFQNIEKGITNGLTIITKYSE